MGDPLHFIHQSKRWDKHRLTQTNTHAQKCICIKDLFLSNLWGLFFNSWFCEHKCKMFTILHPYFRILVGWFSKVCPLITSVYETGYRFCLTWYKCVCEFTSVMSGCECLFIVFFLWRILSTSWCLALLYNSETSTIRGGVGKGCNHDLRISQDFPTGQK